MTPEPLVFLRCMTLLSEAELAVFNLSGMQNVHLAEVVLQTLYLINMLEMGLVYVYSYNNLAPELGCMYTKHCMCTGHTSSMEMR